MFTHKLEQDLIELMPRARRYARALVGDIYTADSLLARSASAVIKNAPPIALLTPKNLVLPWLFIELHKLLDSNAVGIEQQQASVTDQNQSILSAQFDSGIASLSDIQRRAYLLTAVEQFKMPITAHILSLTTEQVRQHFQQAHLLVSDHIKELNSTDIYSQAAVPGRQDIHGQKADDDQLTNDINQSKAA